MTLRRVVALLPVLFAVSLVSGCASGFASGGGADSASSTPSAEAPPGYDWQAANDARQKQQNDEDQATAEQISAQATEQSQQMVQEQQDAFAQQQQLDQQISSEQPGFTP
jgi:hypothetical protein